MMKAETTTLMPSRAGAGGEGGSLTLLCGARSQEKRVMIKAIEGTDPHFRNIPLYLSRQGLRVWERL